MKPKKEMLIKMKQNSEIKKKPKLHAATVRKLINKVRKKELKVRQ